MVDISTGVGGGGSIYVKATPACMALAYLALWCIHLSFDVQQVFKTLMKFPG